MSIYIRAQFVAQPSLIDNFVRDAAVLRDASLAEPGTISYRWFFDPDSSTWCTFEEYVDSAATLSHLREAAPLVAQLGESSEVTLVDVYGEVEEDLRALVAGGPNVTIFVESREISKN